MYLASEIGMAEMITSLMNLFRSPFSYFALFFWVGGGGGGGGGE